MSNSTSGKRWIVPGIALTLFAAAVLLYLPARRYGFINLDDGAYVAENPQIRQGFSGAGIAYALRASVAGNWHPLTMMSHLLDSQVFGLNAGPHHMTSVLLHALNAALLFALLHSCTGTIWRSALVAGLFAVHPLNVESVAWVAQRKTVLSTAFGLLAILAYGRYAAKRSGPWYVLTALLLLLGLLAKPMLVTLPLLLLLLDFWPLRRMGSARTRDLLVEKIPLFVIAAGFSAIAAMTQASAGAVVTIENVPLKIRAVNAVASVFRYVDNMIWPSQLAFFYPYVADPVTPSRLAVCAAGIAVVTAAAIWFRRSCPYLVTGWLWFLTALVPVIGIVQVGAQASADRYAYVPLIGLFIVVAWALEAWTGARRGARQVAVVSAASALALYAGAARIQLSNWRDSISLYTHAIRVTRNNYLAFNNLGTLLDDLGRRDEAIACFQAALRVRPRFAFPRLNLSRALAAEGKSDEALALISDFVQADPSDALMQLEMANLLCRSGKGDEAIGHYLEAIRLDSSSASAQADYAACLSRQGQFDEAAAALREARRLRPDDPAIRGNLGFALAKLGRFDDARAEFEFVLKQDPRSVSAHAGMGWVFSEQSKFDEAIAHYRAALDLKPNLTEALNGLAWVLATAADPSVRNPEEAVRLAERACEINEYKHPEFLDTLAAAHAAGGDAAKAVEFARKAIAAASETGRREILPVLEERLRSYLSGTP
jgi:tetratricopeptide (TPR) repeat protein